MTAPDRRRPARFLPAVALVLATALVAGCGVREDDSPRVLASDQLPSELLAPAPPSTTSAIPVTQQRIYLLETKDGSTEEGLVGVYFNLEVPANSEDFPRRVIEQLVLYRPQDNPNGTAIPPTTSVLDVRRVTGPDGENDILDINLNKLEAQGIGLKQAIAQIVFTATGISGVRGVRFQLNGVPIPVPLDEGESGVGAVVTRADFPQTNPNPPTTTTTTTAAPPAEPVPADVEVPAEE